MTASRTTEVIRYRPPDASQGPVRGGRTVPEQIRASLWRSRAWGRSFDSAWTAALRNAIYPKDPLHRQGWKAVLALPGTVEIWRAAYERGPLPVDVSILISDVDVDTCEDPFVTTKTCTGCGKTLALGEFGKNSATADGLMKTCKPCTRKALREYRARDGRVSANRLSREWAERNRARNRASQKRWREKNREYKAAYDRRRNRDPAIRAKAAERSRDRTVTDRRRETQRAYKARNKERIAARERERYRATHPPRPVLTLRQRFEELVERGGATGSCWKWLGYSNGGYPRFQHQGKTIVAARLAFELYIGPLAAKRRLRHTCGNTFCVNPLHLKPLGV